jgi:hypothetical protein
MQARLFLKNIILRGFSGSLASFNWKKSVTTLLDSKKSHCIITNTPKEA